MSDLYSDPNVLAAMLRLEPELPALFGEVWNDVQPQIAADLKALHQSQNVEQQQAVAERLIDQMSRFPNTQQRLKSELHIQETVKTDIGTALGGLHHQLGMDESTFQSSLDAMIFGLHWSLDPDDLPAVDEMTTRAIRMKPGAVGGGKSIKFSNLNLDLGELCSIASSVGTVLVGTTNGLLIAAGLLGVIATLIKASTVSVNEQDASVFWGFIQTRDMTDSSATEADIIASTNRERARYNRTQLKDADILASLTNLEALKSIAPEGHQGRWKLIESFKIKP